jgi:glycine/D-amino acid oxidase-like deaminating enzyme
LCAARRLAELAPDASIALIEADRIGRSTAGRNSGFFVDLPHDISSESYSRSVEADKADVRMQRHGIDYVRDVVKRFGIDCDWRDEGKYHASVNRKGHAALAHFAEGLARIDEPCEWLDENAIAKVTGTRFYQSALFTPGCSTVQPAALMRGLAATQPANVKVFELSAVKAMEARGDGYVLSFASGRIVAKHVVLCTNAYAATFGGHPNGLLPVYTFASMSRVMTDDEVARLGGANAWALIPADPMGTTVRRLATNRICVRNHFAFRPNLSVSENDLAKAKHLHQRSFERRFPMLKDVGLEYTWGGALCLSANNGALFGQREDGVFEAVGCNGLGLSRGSAAGKLIAEHALGRTNALIEQLLRQPHPRSLPMRPIADVAVSAAIWVKEFSAGAEL